MRPLKNFGGSMDPFEEFEFRPLTEGIGFHKKTSSLKESAEKSALVEEKLNRAVPEPPPEALLQNSASRKTSVTSYEDLLKSLEKPVLRENAAVSTPDLEITETLPRPESKIRTSAVVEPQPEIQRTPPLRGPESKTPNLPLKGNLPNKTFIESSVADTGVRRGAADSPIGGLEKAPVCLRSAILDFVFVMALSLVFLVSLLMITKVNLSVVIANSKIDFTTQMSMLILFVAVMQMYVVVARSFFGRTLGEWTFDHQMGSVKQQSSPYYPLLVAWRSLVVTVTGIFLLPVLSFIFRKDLTAPLTGLQLYRQRS